jgi:glycosyltransferase involved in cell wall biosynthesis
VSKRIGILTTNFYSPDGLRMIYGGAERYGFELTKLLMDLGYKVAWWQIGSGWQKELLHGVQINSIRETKNEFMTFPRLNQHFHEQAMELDYAIYFVTFLAYPQVLEKSISISHGVFWDYPEFDSQLPTESAKKEWLRRYHIALSGPQKVVSVDTNTINWINATWPGLSHKLEYIPNFADINSLKPRGNASNKIKVIFPRRLTSVRGLNEACHAAKVLTSRYPDKIEFHFVGRGHSDLLEAEALKWASENKNIYYYWQPPHIMYEIYSQMDIALIPTKATEGTSLSCLEAMASGCAVIATPVGGLTDLIIDGYNGILIKPTSSNLIEAIEYLLNNEDERQRMGKNAKKVAEAFDIERWKQKWEKVIKQVFR